MFEGSCRFRPRISSMPNREQPGQSRPIALEYLSIRYTDEQIAAAQGNRADQRIQNFARLERRNFPGQGISIPGTFSADQLYDLSKDPDSQNNLAADPSYAGQLKENEGHAHPNREEPGPCAHTVNSYRDKEPAMRRPAREILDKLSVYHATENKKKK